MSGLRFGYGTNGFANHRLDDALAVIADLGYEGVALTLDHDHLDPFADGLARRVAALSARLSSLGLSVVIETGARYLLDPWRKHAPTLLDDDREPRLEFLARAVDIGADLGAEAVSFWAGVRPATVGESTAWDRLVDGCAQIVEVARRRGVTLGFEPEPGMLVPDIAGWRRLHADLGAPAEFGITLDIGHCRCLEPIPVPDCVTAVAEHLVNVQIDDMRRDVHEHLEFGHGEIDFPPVLAALSAAGYAGLVAVELPRHSHAAPTVAARSLEFLRAARNSWLADAVARVRADPPSIVRLFAQAGRRCRPGEGARARLLRALPPETVPHWVDDLYRHGDAAEKLAVLEALPELPLGGEAVPLLHDALRTNDTRLITAALGPYARHLDQHAWRHAVLKCVFLGVPLKNVDHLDQRADRELAAMISALHAERAAAGRELPADAHRLLDRIP